MRAKKLYQQYKPGTAFCTAFDEEKIPIFTMEDLRELDFTISRGISYERTVDEFLTQMAVNYSFRNMVNRKEIAILLNEEGALVREAGEWLLYFTPNKNEEHTLHSESALYPVLKSIEEKYKNGEVCRVKVPDRTLKTLVSGAAPFSILDEYCKHQPGRYLSVAENIVINGTEELFRNVPVCSYNKLQTVDKDEIENYGTIKSLLDDYIVQCQNAENGERIQPLSIAVFGYPGSGKSFGVKQLAKTSRAFETMSINLSQYEGPTQFFEVFDEAISSCSDKIPLVFFDEFDSELNGISRGWLKYFLTPMQDGEYSIRGKARSISRAVFVFAGGTAHSFNDFQPNNDVEKEAAFIKVKGPDFVSRLKGILNIKGLNPSTNTDRSHIIRRAIMLRQNIIRSTPSIYDSETGVINISQSLLSSLLRVSEYRHGARSMEFILAMCRLSGVKKFTPSCLPLHAQLDIHLDAKDFHQKLSFEQIMGKKVEQYAKITHERYRKHHLAENNGVYAKKEDGAAIAAHAAEMVDWETLDEFFKEGYRSRIRYLGEYLVSYNTTIGVRTIVPGAMDTIRELYGPDLEELSDIEHKRWIKDKYEDGWKCGPKNSELKISPELVPFSELSEEKRDFIRKEVREVPSLLAEIGYELYHKAY